MCLSRLLFFPASFFTVSLLPPFPLSGLYFIQFSCCSSDRMAPHPFFYSSMSSPLLWEWPVFCKRSGDRRHVGPGCNRRERLFRPAQTGSQKQVTAPQHCPKCWICECVCWLWVCRKVRERESSSVPMQIQQKNETKLSVTSATHRAVKLANGTMSSFTLCS